MNIKNCCFPLFFLTLLQLLGSIKVVYPSFFITVHDSIRSKLGVQYPIDIKDLSYDIERSTAFTASPNLGEDAPFQWTISFQKGVPAFCVAAPSSVVTEDLDSFYYAEDPSVLQSLLPGAAVLYPKGTNDTAIFYMVDKMHMDLWVLNATLNHSISTLPPELVQETKIEFTLNKISMHSYGSFNTTQPMSYHILLVDDMTLLIMINGNIVTFNLVNPMSPTFGTFSSLQNPVHTGAVAYNSLLYVSASTQGIDVYDLSGYSASINCLYSLDSGKFGTGSLNLTALDIDQKSSILYVADYNHGIYFISLQNANRNNLHSLGVSPLNTAENLQGAFQLAFGGSSLFVGRHSTDGEYLLVQLSKLSANSTLWSTLRIIETLPTSSYLKLGSEYVFLSSANLFTTIRHSVPSMYVEDERPFSSQSFEVNLVFAHPFTLNQKRYVLAVSKSQFEIFSIYNSIPSLSCFAGNRIGNGEYVTNNTVVSSSCQKKVDVGDTSPFSVCYQSFLIKFNVYEPFFESPKKALIVGLTVGLTVAVVFLFCCIYYFRKTKNYEKLRSEIEPMNERNPRSDDKQYSKKLSSNELGTQDINLELGSR